MIDSLSKIRKELVVIPSLHGAGIDETQLLWDGITAHEYFPSINGSAFYVLTVQVIVESVSDIPRSDAALDRAMALLALSWPFAGGSFLPIEQRIRTKAETGQSNAAAVREQILARDGLKNVTAYFSLPLETIAEYAQPPLATAARIARAMHAAPRLTELLGYHQTSWMEYHFHQRGAASSWFLHLYKVRDFLQKRFNGENNAVKALGLTSSSWIAIGNRLNNGYRHATAQVH